MRIQGHGYLNILCRCVHYSSVGDVTKEHAGFCWINIIR